ncbi:hypothetical protein WA026_018318 [Henosepilachna vigintioctopunctata]|uniref:Lipase domain-containing protein n=1 Tax=Henosepilachna vigintioctopunctata TaxID=420089 RepID=A0AAW1VI12_9CUCU
MLVTYVLQLTLLVTCSYGAVIDIPDPDLLPIPGLSVAKIDAVIEPVIVDKGTKTFIGKVHNGVFDVEKGFVDGLHEVVGTPVDLEQLTFHLVTAKNVGAPSKINFFKPDDVANTTGKIVFLIHGWQSSMNSSWVRDLSEILIKRHPGTHVVEVNWDGPAADNYAFSAFVTESAGDYVGILINRLVSDYKIPLKNILVIGHSLGAQISGWAAKKFIDITGKKLPRIVALDPAGPLFILRPDSRRLNKKDADVVSVVHTDADKLGFPDNCGTLDFFPNGGDNQPGCWTVDLAKISTYVEPVTCDHSRAWDFFVEAVNNTNSFLARKCASNWYSKNEDCTDEVVAMGDLETKATGSFYLETNEHRPYSKPLLKLKKKDAVEKVNVTQKVQNATAVTTEKSVDDLSILDFK